MFTTIYFFKWWYIAPGSLRTWVLVSSNLNSKFASSSSSGDGGRFRMRLMHLAAPMARRHRTRAFWARSKCSFFSSKSSGGFQPLSLTRPGFFPPPPPFAALGVVASLSLSAKLKSSSSSRTHSPWCTSRDKPHRESRRKKWLDGWMDGWMAGWMVK